MFRLNPLISKYILLTIAPYFGFAWLLLSVILFVQQAGRYSDIFFSVNLPSALVWQLAFALVPNVIAFTCPMAVLIGVIIGLSKMQGDSELIAIRASGVGNLQITLPILFLGILLSLFAFFINLKGVPYAARVSRNVAYEIALFKLQSPIEPGTFNTEVNNYTIYVKGGDIERGTWKNVFIYNDDKKGGLVRLITSKSGKVDSNDKDSELVLDNASINTFSLVDLSKNLVTESVSNFRLAIKTKKQEIIQKLTTAEETPEEMGLKQLLNYAKSKIGKERTEAEILFQRRIILSVTPIFFALLGTSLVLRFNRGGKGWGIFLALVSLVGYYLIALLGEQLARNGGFGVFVSLLLPILVTSTVIMWFFMSQRLFLNKKLFEFIKLPPIFKSKPDSQAKAGRFLFLNSGIMDFDIVLNLLKYFVLTISFLTVIYYIFTAFELWKFVALIPNGVGLLATYFLYLTPFIYIQIAPSALMIATLATYVIKSRNNEVVIWTASGQSIYRLLMPCFLLMAVIGAGNWLIQEKVLPYGNKVQDGIRTAIRNQGNTTLKSGKNWVAVDDKIYSFELPKDYKDGAKVTEVNNLNVYQFTDDGATLVSFALIPQASWESGKIKFLSDASVISWINGLPQKATVSATSGEIKENFNPFKAITKKPAHLSTAETVEMIENSESESERRMYQVALWKKYATPFLPLIITLFTAPFALTLSRKGKVVTIGYAVGLWLLFMGATSIFEQYGLNGTLEPIAAVWSPLILFSILGFFLLSKVKT